MEGIRSEQHKRITICYARAIGLAVFQWFCTWCIVKTLDGEIIDKLPSKYIVQLLDTLLAYKPKAVSQKLDGAPHCALWMLKAQVFNVVKFDSWVEKLWNQRMGEPSRNFTLTLDAGCTVQWKDDAIFVCLFFDTQWYCSKLISAGWHHRPQS